MKIHQILISGLLVFANLAHSMIVDTPESKLFRGAKNDNIALIKEALELGANVNAVNGIGYNAIMMAIEKANVDAVNFLIRSGANPNFQNREGKTALMYAAAIAYISEDEVELEDKIHQIITSLIQADADINLTDNQNKNVFDLARGRNQLELIEFIKDVNNQAVKQKITDFLPADLAGIVFGYTVDQ